MQKIWFTILLATLLVGCSTNTPPQVVSDHYATTLALSASEGAIVATIAFDPLDWMFIASESTVDDAITQFRHANGNTVRVGAVPIGRWNGGNVARVVFKKLRDDATNPIITTEISTIDTTRITPPTEANMTRIAAWSPTASNAMTTPIHESNAVTPMNISIPVNYEVPFDTSFAANTFGSVTGFGLTGRTLTLTDVVRVSSAVGGTSDAVAFFTGSALSPAERTYRSAHADINGNGVINGIDVILGLRKYVDGCSPTQTPGVDDCGSLASELVVIPPTFDASSACVLTDDVRTCSALVVNAGNVPFPAAPVTTGFPSALFAEAFGHVVQLNLPRLFSSSVTTSVTNVGSRTLAVNFPGVSTVQVIPSAPQVLPLGSTLALSANVTVVGQVDTSVTWTSSNAAVAGASSSGVVTPVAAGVAVVTATAVGDSGVSGSVTVTVPAALVGSAYASVGGSVGVPVSVAPSGVSGGFGALSFAVHSGALPGGLLLNAASGLISGVPLESGSFSGVVRVSDSSSPRQSRDLAFSMVISGVEKLVVSNYAITDAFVGDSVSVSPVVSGGFGDLVFVLDSGALPAGVSLNAASGVLAGSVSVPGRYFGEVSVSDEAGQVGAAQFLFVVSGVPGSVVASDYVSVSVAAGEVVSMPAVVSGGVSPLSFVLSSGSLPLGVVLDPVSGLISGVPSDVGLFSGVVTVSDAVGVTVPVSFVLSVSRVIPSLVALPYGSFSGLVGDEVLMVPRGVAGGFGRWSFTLVDGGLPDGVVLDADSGVISGTATEMGSFAGSVRVADEASNFVVVSFSLVISEVVEPLAFGGYEVVSVVRNVSFSVSPSGVSGGAAPLSFSVVSGALPDGVFLNAGSGVVSGAASVVGAFAAVVSVSDALGSSVPVSLLISVGSDAGRLSVVPYGLVSTVVGSSLSASVGFSGGDLPLVFSLLDGALPDGVSLDAGSGVIAGVPTVVGSFSGSVLVEDAGGQSAVVGFFILVSPAAGSLVVGDYVPVRSLVGSGVNMPVVGLVGGSAPVSFEVAAGSLPAGVSLNASSGLIFGVPTVTGSFNGAVLVSDSLGQVAVAAFSLVVFSDVPALVVLPYAGGSVIVGDVFSIAPNVVSDGSGDLTFALVSGELPEGVTLDAASGVIGGSTSALGGVSVAVQVTDSSGQRAVVSASFSVGNIVSELVFGPYLTASGRVGEALVIPSGLVSGGSAPFSFSLVSGSLPEGVTLGASTGALSGIPSVAGSFEGVVRVTDAAGSTAFSAFGFLVNSNVAPLVVLPYASTSRLVDSAMSIAANVSSFGALPLEFELVEGALPTGVTLNAVTGLISGTPSVTGSFSGAVRVSDAVGQSATATFLITVTEDVTQHLVDAYPTITRVLNQALSLESVNARGGVTPYVFSLSSGAFPAGVTVGSSGTISGVPTETGLFSGLVRVEDAVGQVTTAPFFISIVSDAEPISWLPYSDATILEGGTLSLTANVSGGEAPFEFVLVAGTLPTGATLNSSTGSITGTITEVGSFTGAIRVTDALGQRATASYRILVTPDVTPITFSGYGFTNLTVGTPTNLTPLSVSGGVSPYAFTLASGTLPAGLNLETDGVITGTPTTAGSYSGIIRVTDTVNQTAAAAFAFVVTPAFEALVATPYASAVTVVNSLVSMTPVGVSGGFGSLSFALVSGSLPGGVSLDASSGVISGTVSDVGSFSGAVAVTDEVGSRVVVTFSLVVTPNVTPLSPVAYANVSGVVGSSLSVSSGVSGGLTPYAFELLVGSLPAGVSLNAVTGTISGTPSVAGSFSGTVKVTDSLGQAAGVTFSVVVAPNVPPLSGGVFTASELVLGASAELTPSTVSGGTPPYAFSVSSGALPGGLSLNASSGVISGTPSGVGSFAAVVTLSDEGGQSLASAVGLSVVEPATPLVVGSYANEVVTVGDSVSVTPAVESAGNGALAFTLEAGTLPPGVTLNAATGTLSGVTTTVGVYSGVIRVTDERSLQALTGFSVTVRPVELVVTAYPNTTVTEGVEFTVSPASVTGGAAPLSFTLVGSLPTGVTLNADTGAISGSTTELGVYSGLVRVTDSFGLTTAAAFLFEVVSNAAELTLQPYPVTSALVGSSVTVNPVGFSGGAPVVSFAVTAGALPGGVTLNAASGVLSGSPSVAGSFAGVVTVSDAVGQRVRVTFSFTVSDVVTPLSAASYAAATLVEGQVVSIAGPSVSGGVSPYAFSLLSGALPNGVSLTAGSGALSGTPSLPGVFSGVILVSDAAGQSLPLSFAFTVVPDVEPLAVLPYGTVTQVSGSVLNLGASVTGGREPLSFTRLSGTLPPGVTLNATSGALSGTLGAVGSYSGVIGVVDAVGQSATASFSVVVTPDVTPVVMSDYASQEFLDGALVSFSPVGVSGGAPDYSFALISGALPAGLSLNASSGVISGSASEVGLFAGVVQVTDSVGQTAIGSFSFTVLSSANPLLVLPYTPVSALVGGSVSTSPSSVSGGSGGLSFAVVGGSLPAGVTLNASSGVISGSPSESGSFVGAVRVVDSVGQRVVVTFSLVISPNVPALAASNYVTQTVLANVAFSASPVGVTGGLSPYTYQVVSGALPANVTLKADGVISGTPTAEGTFAATVMVRDASGQSVPVSFGVTVLPNVTVLTVSPYASTSVIVGTAVNLTANVSGGRTPYAFSLVSGALPTGLSLNASTGAISGTPSAIGTASGAVRVTDALGSTSTLGFLIEVRPTALVVSNYTTLTAQVSTSTDRSLTPNVSGGLTPYTYTLLFRSSTTLPSENSPYSWTFGGNGVLSGKLVQVGSWSGSVLVRDAWGQSGTANYTIVGQQDMAFVVGNFAPVSLPVNQAATLTPTQFSGDSYLSGYALECVLKSGTLPPGMSFCSGGEMGRSTRHEIRGTPTTTGTYSGVIEYTDAFLKRGSAGFNITIIVPLSASNYASTSVALNAAVSMSPVGVSGGSGALTYALASGSLPTGVTLNTSTGVISGTPSATGVFGGTVRITDSVGTTATVSFALSVTPPEIVAEPFPAGVGEINFALSMSPGSVSGATAPLTYVLASGSLPAGVSVNSATGLISGTPTASGSFSGFVRVTDSLGATTLMQFSLVVSTASSALSFTSYGTISTSQGVTLRRGAVVSGGTKPYSFSIDSGGLPTGITVDPSNGTIVGRSYRSDRSDWARVRVTDAVGRTTTATVTVDLRYDITKTIATASGRGGDSMFIPLPADSAVGDAFVIMIGSYGRRSIDRPSNCIRPTGVEAGTSTTGARFDAMICEVTQTAVDLTGYNLGDDSENWVYVSYLIRGGYSATVVEDCNIIASSATSTSATSSFAAPSITAYKGFSFNAYVTVTASTTVTSFGLGAGTAGRTLTQVQNDGVGLDTGTTTTVAMGTTIVRRTGTVSTDTQTATYTPNSARTVAISGYCETSW